MPDIEFTTTLKGEHRLVAAFERLPEALRHRLVAPITALTRTLLSRVVAREPSRTGSLRGHTRSFVDEREDRVTGKVKVLPDPERSYPGAAGHNIAAAALEYGAHGSAAVPAHARTISEAWGRAIAPQEVLVSAYRRRVNLPELAFERGAEAGMGDELRRAVEGALGEMAKTFERTEAAR